MNKKEFIHELAGKSGFTKKDTEVLLDQFTATITQSLKKGEEVKLIGFGTFLVHHRKATTGRNPRTGEKLKIKASKQAKFKAGKALKEVLN